MSVRDEWKDEAGDALSELLEGAQRASDVGMSEADGAQMWERLQAAPRRRRAPIGWIAGVAAALVVATALASMRRPVPVEIVKEMSFESVHQGKAVRFEMTVYRERRRRRTMPTSRLFDGILLAVVLAALAAPARAAAPDPLARPEFDQDLTLTMRGETVVRVYDALASFAHVPFILAFDESDPSLKVTFKAENMGVRAILGSLAKTYDLEYTKADTAILVTRKGRAPTEKRTIVGPWQAPVPQYRFDYVLRVGDRVLSTPWVTTGLKQEVRMTQGGQAVLGAPEMRMEVDLTPRKETAEGLELGVQWSLHEGTTKTASPRVKLFSSRHLRGSRCL